MGLRPLACWNCVFEARRGHECLSLENVVCCQVEVPASGRSLVQKGSAECGESECDLETSATGVLGTKGGSRAMTQIGDFSVTESVTQ